MILRSFTSLRWFTVYMENSLRFDRSEICTEVSFTSTNLNSYVTLHRREILPRSEISNPFEFFYFILFILFFTLFTVDLKLLIYTQQKSLYSLYSNNIELIDANSVTE